MGLKNELQQIKSISENVTVVISEHYITVDYQYYCDKNEENALLLDDSIYFENNTQNKKIVNEIFEVKEMKALSDNLIEIANEYVKQDNMMTAYPIAIALQVLEEKVAADGCDYDELSVELDGEYFTCSTKEEVWEQYADDECIEVEEAKQKYKDEINDYDDLEDLINLLWDNPRIIPIKKEHVFTGNLFLTMSGYEKHIKSNGHNLRGARPYLVHLFRNHEMTVIAEQLMDIATLPKKEWCEAALRYYKKNKIPEQMEGERNESIK